MRVQPCGFGGTGHGGTELRWRGADALSAETRPRDLTPAPWFSPRFWERQHALVLDMQGWQSPRRHNLCTSTSLCFQRLSSRWQGGVGGDGGASTSSPTSLGPGRDFHPRTALVVPSFPCRNRRSCPRCLCAWRRRLSPRQELAQAGTWGPQGTVTHLRHR